VLAEAADTCTVAAAAAAQVPSCKLPSDSLIRVTHAS